MLYVKALTIPANTTALAPFSARLVCTAGQVSEVQICFPSGCVGLVGVRVKDFEHVIWPTNPDEWIIADGEVVDWDEAHDMAGTPWTLTVEGYNLDDSYSHTIYFRFAMIPLEKLRLTKKFWDWVRGW